MTMSETLKERIQRWHTDLPLFAQDVLRIQDKSANVIPLHLNEAQTALHALLEAQKRELGNIWAVILKGRQCGSTTYDVGRFTWQCMARKGVHALTLAQDDFVASKVGGMCNRYQDLSDQRYVRTMTRRSDHAKEWNNGSTYEFRTSSTGRSHRGFTLQLLHFTEMAYFQDAGSQLQSALQTMSEDDGNEVICESTARGPAGAWAELWREANDPDSKWQPIFLPWTLTSEYAVPAPAGFTLTHDAPNDFTLSEVEYAERHGCSLDQMAWRRAKVRELGATGEDGFIKFAHEYPACPEDAFESSAFDSFISPRVVEQARTRRLHHRGVPTEPLIIGVDPAPSHGNSGTAIAWRRGNDNYFLDRWYGIEPDDQLNQLAAILERDTPARMEIDESEEFGAWLIRELRRLRIGGVVQGTRFGGAPDDRGRYTSKRVEMWARMAAWLNEDVSIYDERPRPGRPTLHSELLAPKRTDNYGAKMTMEKKSDMRKRGIPSPDGADALALTFARGEPAAYEDVSWVAPGPFDDPYSPQHGPSLLPEGDGNLVIPGGYF